MNSSQGLPGAGRPSAVRSTKWATAVLGLVVAVGSAVPFAVWTIGASAQTGVSALRVIQGKVFAAGGEPQSGAVVYLKDQKTLEIKTYISTGDGTYRFGQLGTADDYQLWAEFGGHKSKNKSISAFDSKKVFDISLHLEDK